MHEALRAAEFDPRELEQTEERLFALRAAARKYNVPADELAALRQRFVEDLAAIDAGEEQLTALERAIGGGRHGLCDGRQKLSVRPPQGCGGLDRQCRPNSRH